MIMFKTLSLKETCDIVTSEFGVNNPIEIHDVIKENLSTIHKMLNFYENKLIAGIVLAKVLGIHVYTGILFVEIGRRLVSDNNAER